jgi:O-succinylbenzoic acid--CoA ligase
MSAPALSVFEAARVDDAAPAVVSDERTLSFAELAERAGRAIAWLRRRGVAPGRPVAVAPRVDVETLALLHGLVAWGVPIVLVHPRLLPEERRFVVADSGAELFVEDPAAELTDAWGLEPVRPAPPPSDRAPLAILYTSGTTGRPKGAVLSRAAFVAAARASAENLGWTRDDRWLLCMPLAHVGGFSVVTRTLLARRAVVLPAGARTAPFEPRAVLDALERHRVTLLSVVPTMMKRLLDVGRPLPPSLRAILLGGAATPAALLERCAELRLPTLTTYGLTEACSQVTTQRLGTRPGVEQGSGPPMAGVEVRIGEGERIEIRGPTLMNGYHPPGVHAHPFLEGGWFRTEDLGRLDAEGRLHVLGRREELVVTGGENVYPLEVEQVVDAAPGVRASCVFGVPDEEWGQIVCVAVVASGALDRDALAQFLMSRLAPHKRPRRIAELEELPVTAAGKLDRRAVPALAAPNLVPLAYPKGGPS